jgi:hypothetical protein
MNEPDDIDGQGPNARAWTTPGKGSQKMLGRSRTALCVSLCLFAGCYSEDRPLNDFLPGGSGGTSSTGGSGANADAGEDAEGGASVAATGGGPAAGTAGTAGSGQAANGGANAGSGGANAGNGGASAVSGSAGTSGDGSSGDGGTSSVPVGALCNSSDGTGCDVTQFCIDAVKDACPADYETTCAGFCAEPAPRTTLPSTCTDADCPVNFSCVNDPVDPGRSFCTGTLACEASNTCPDGFVCGADGLCAPDKVACTGTVLCPINPGLCPAGYTHSIVDDCFGPCVPLESCVCEKDLDCVDRATSCDRLSGRCVYPKAPEPRCALPFETGDCLAAQPVFAFVDGSCQPQTYGGCGGNDNRFWSLEECRARCEGRPVPDDCPEGHVLKSICLECGPGGGCPTIELVCAKTCDPETANECESLGFNCYDDVCQSAPCF